MPLIWCAISGHGFGHAAQVVPVLNELHRRMPSVTAVLRTSLPAPVFQNRLPLPWTLSTGQQDIGCLQDDALTIDLAGTWQAHTRFHDNWEERVDREAASMRAHQADIVLADIPYLAIAAADRAGIRAVGLSSLSWDSVLRLLREPKDPGQQALIEAIAQAYAKARIMIRAEPALPMPAFSHVATVGPIVSPLHRRPEDLRQALQADDDELIVAVGFGGLGLNSLPWDAMESMKGYRFVVPERVPAALTRTRSAEDLPWPFRQIMASSDMVITKPGYGTIVETVMVGIPVIYVRRYNFADEESLVTYLHRHGHGVELPARDFRDGRWTVALDQARGTMGRPPVQPPPPPTGAIQATDLLLQQF